MIPLTFRSARTAQSKREALAEKAREEKISPEKASRIQLKLSRRLPLDGIRCIAILWVIMAHLGWKSADGAVVTWSLAVEEQFYFAWPLALIFLLRRKWKLHCFVALLLAVAAASALRRFLLWNGPASRPRVYFFKAS